MSETSDGISDRKEIRGEMSRQLRWRRTVFLAASLLLLAFGAGRTGIRLHSQAERRRGHPYIFLGRIFSGLQDVLKGERAVGYITDKDLDERAAAMQFAQAQYTLAPVILDFNDPAHRYLLFDCSSPEAAAELIQKTGAVPLKQNRFGIILAAGRPDRAFSGKGPVSP